MREDIQCRSLKENMGRNGIQWYCRVKSYHKGEKKNSFSLLVEAPCIIDCHTIKREKFTKLRVILQTL